MQVVKENKAFDHPRARIIAFFRRGDLHFTSGVHLCFVCGAADPRNDEPPKLRRRFLDWVLLNEEKIVCVLAENAVTDLLREVSERQASKDLTVIEETIASTVDSLLLFPESPGSFAELGLFSANEDIAKKMLVAIAAEHQGGSFIILGPIKRVNSVSSYSPQPLVHLGNDGESFRLICDRLLGEELHVNGYSKRFAHKEWKEYSSREQLAVIDKIADLVGVVTEDDLFDLINKSFGRYEKAPIRLLVGLLVSMKRVYRNEWGDIIRNVEASRRPFLDGAAEQVVEVKASWTEAYREHIADALKELEGANYGLL